MDQYLISHIEKELGTEIIRHSTLSGGDISEAYLIDTTSNHYFCKVNSNINGLSNFKCETAGLKAIADTKTIRVPEVILLGQLQKQSYLILEYISSRKPQNNELRLFGEQLAQLHQHTSDQFGWSTDNFIGSLPQSNKMTQSWLNFWITQRLTPQFQYAVLNGFMLAAELPQEEQMKQAWQDLFQEIKPSLLHGDLWGGNYLISEHGQPILIDPSTYYGHSEVDLAMSKLFGGFAPAFYKGYANIIPAQKGANERMDIYQLYYLLVHLNLFGRSYYSAVKSILKKCLRSFT